MLKFNEMTRQFETVEIKFMVGEMETSDEKLMIRIPEKYVSKFEGHHFPTMSVLSKALMEAHCAEEAYYYKMPHKINEHEMCMNNWLTK